MISSAREENDIDPEKRHNMLELSTELSLSFQYLSGANKILIKVEFYGLVF